MHFRITLSNNLLVNILMLQKIEKKDEKKACHFINSFWLAGGGYLHCVWKVFFSFIQNNSSFHVNNVLHPYQENPPNTILTGTVLKHNHVECSERAGKVLGTCLPVCRGHCLCCHFFHPSCTEGQESRWPFR